MIRRRGGPILPEEAFEANARGLTRRIDALEPDTALVNYYDDAAKMGLGMINSGVQIAGQQSAKRNQRKLRKLSEAQEQRHHKDQLHDLGLAEEDVNRQAGYQNDQIREDMGDQQGPGGSQAGHLQRRNEGERSRRYKALETQKTRLTADWLDEEKAAKINSKMAKNAARMQMISGLLQQGGSSLGGGNGGMF